MHIYRLYVHIAVNKSHSQMALGLALLLGVGVREGGAWCASMRHKKAGESKHGLKWFHCDWGKETRFTGNTTRALYALLLLASASSHFFSAESTPQSTMTAQEHLMTLLALPSLSILQRPTHSPMVLFLSTR